MKQLCSTQLQKSCDWGRATA